MDTLRPKLGGAIVAFRARISASASLTLLDRMEVVRWHEQAQRFGYDRLVIHERLAGDPPEVGSFLSVYRRGEPWSRFGITRLGGRILAWCCVTGADIGRFDSVAEALMALLPADVTPMAAVAGPALPDNVIPFN